MVVVVVVVVVEIMGAFLANPQLKRNKKSYTIIKRKKNIYIAVTSSDNELRIYPYNFLKHKIYDPYPDSIKGSIMT